MYVSWIIPAAHIDATAGLNLLLRIKSELDLNKIQFLIDFSEVQSVDEEGFIYLLEGGYTAKRDTLRDELYRSERKTLRRSTRSSIVP